MVYKDINKRRATRRLYRTKNKEKYNLLNKTFHTHIIRMYSGMKSRVEGRNPSKIHLYKGLFILPKEDFYAFATQDVMYKLLWEAWKNSNYTRLLTPTPNRKDSKKGYSIDNIEFITSQENSKLAHVGRTFYRGRFSK